MKITQRGRQRDHGRYPICSTTVNFGVKVTTDDDSNVSVKECEYRYYVEVELENDLENSGGGDHRHFARVEFHDIAKILSTISDTIGDSKNLSTQLKQAFDGEITSIERLKLAVLGVI